MNSVWVKGCWAERTEASDEHVLTEKGVLRGKCVRRMPPSTLEAEGWYKSLVG